MKQVPFSALGRPVDIRYPSNKRILQLIFAMTLLSFFYHRDIWTALQSGANLFFVWALNREIDPDHDQAALLAAVLFGIITFFVIGNSSFLSLFWLLLALRTLNLCVGLPILAFDYAAFAILGIISSLQIKQPAILILTIFILFLIRWQRNEKNTHPGIALSIAGLFILIYIEPGVLSVFVPAALYSPASFAVPIIFIIVMMLNKEPVSFNDQGTTLITKKNLAAAGLLFIIYTYIILLTGLPAQQGDLLLSVMAGSAIYSIYNNLFLE